MKWEPDWIVSPGEMLQEWMDENGVTPRTMAVAIVGRHSEHLPAVLATITHVLKKRPMTKRAATILARGTFITPRFWLALEHNYRFGKARGKKESE